MDEKIIVISGGTRGLGFSYAKELSEYNKVIILARTKKDLEEVSKEIRCDYKQCDIKSHKEIENVVSEIQSEYNKIDILINNAGIWLDGDLEECDYESIQNVISTNLTGQIFLTKAFLPLLKNSNKSLIVNTNSTAGKTTRGEISVYNASKWGLRSFSYAMNDYLKNKNIVSIDVFPGGINTTLFDRANSPRDLSKYLNPDLVAERVIENIKLYFDEDVVIDDIELRHLK